MSLDDIYTRSKPLRLAIFDVDGVLTDGGLHYSDSGEETKVFDVRDGLGMRMLQASGIALAIITSRTSGCVAQRARDLGIELLFQGVENKLEAFEGLVRDLSITPAACAYMETTGWISRCFCAAVSPSRCRKRRRAFRHASITLRARRAGMARRARHAR